MKKKATLRAAVTAILIMALLMLAACSGGNPNSDSANSGDAGNEQTSNASQNTSDSSASETEAEKSKEPITLKVLFNSTDKDMEKTDVYQEIIDRTGITMDIEKYDEEKFKVMLAGGDLPDIIQVPDKYIIQLIEGNNILPLEDLIQTNGPDIQKPVYEKSLASMRKNKSNGTDKLYMIPIQIGPGDFDFDQQVGVNFRWDYYKEIGAPKLNSIDDIVDAIAKMVENHPTTADGKKTYGVTMWNDWGFWGLQSIGLITGHSGWGKANLASWSVPDQDYFNQYTDPEHSAIWDTAYFLYKANQAGVLDPDAFTDKYNDVVAKASQGTLLYGAATWPFENVNAELLKEGPDKGFITIPLDWGFTHVAGNNIGGWGDKWFAITKNAKDPERAMDLINFLASEEGSRLIASGIEGIHWELVDGKPQLKEETIALASEGGDAWKKTGIGSMTNQQGLGDFTTLSDGGIVRLFNTPEVHKTRMNSLHEDYSKHYGVEYPAMAYKQYVEAGQVLTKNDNPSEGLSGMQALPEELDFISKKLDDMILKGVPQVVLNAKTDEEYTAMQQQLIQELKDAGADKVFDWVYKEFERVKPDIVY